MKTFENCAAQGDLLITKVGEVPEGFEKTPPVGDQHIVAHSETGHHHVLANEGVDLYQAANDDFALYVVVSQPTELKHLRSFDTHESLLVSPGVYRINRQREYVPEGFRRVAD